MKKVVILFAMLFAMPALAQIAPGGGGRRTHSASERGAVEEVKQLLIEHVAADVNASSCDSAPIVSCGGSYTSTPTCLASEFYLDFHIFNATAGQTVTLRATTSTGYPLLLTIQNYNTGDVITSVDGYSPQTLVYTFPSTASYVIGFAYVQKNVTGSYTLSVTCASAPPPPPPPGTCFLSGTLVRGVSVTASLGPSDAACANNDVDYYKVYEFDGTAGTPVRITITATFPKYTEVASKSDTATRLSQWSDSLVPYLIFYPQATGKQVVWVGQDLAQPTVGSFTITITDEPLDPCRRRAVGH